MRAYLIPLLLLAACEKPCCLEGDSHVVEVRTWTGDGIAEVEMAIAPDGDRFFVWRRTRDQAMVTRVLQRDGSNNEPVLLRDGEEVLGATSISAHDSGALVVGTGPADAVGGAPAGAVVGLWLDSRAAPIGPRFVIAPDRVEVPPVVAFDGAAHVVAYGDATGVWMQRVPPAGAPGPRVRVSPIEPVELRVAAHGGMALVAWLVDAGPDRFAALAVRVQDGAVLDAEPIVVTDDLERWFHLAAGPGGFLVAGPRAPEELPSSDFYAAFPIDRDGRAGAVAPLPPVRGAAALVAAGDGYVLASGFGQLLSYPSGSTGAVTLRWLRAGGTMTHETMAGGAGQAIAADGADVVLATLHDDATAAPARSLIVRAVAPDGTQAPRATAVISPYTEHISYVCSEPTNQY